MSEKEVIEQIESLIDDRNNFIDPEDKNKDNIFRKDKKALQTVLQLLEQKENIIKELEDETYKMSEYMKEIATKRNKAIDKLKEVKREFLDFCPDCVDLAGELLDILEE